MASKYRVVIYLEVVGVVFRLLTMIVVFPLLCRCGVRLSVVVVCP